VDPVERRRDTIYIAIPIYSIPQLICRMRRSRRYQALFMCIYINIKRGDERRGDERRGEWNKKAANAVRC
jgi:hypothetical protein